MFNNCHISHILSCQNEPVKFADFCTTQVEIDVRLGLSSTLLELLSHGDRSYPGALVFLHCALDTRESHRKPAAVGFMLRYAIAMYVYIYIYELCRRHVEIEGIIGNLHCFVILYECLPPNHPKARKNQSRKKFGKLMARTGSC